MQEDGTIKMIKKKATVLSYRVGDYTFVDDISNLNYLSMTMNAWIPDCFVALLLAMTVNA